ncbi:MAG TPA: 30S ribosomal protein S19 [Candidatus Woesearchaeota archaeon]|nr:MAG: 30S ribosomal protein S19 [Candidatus Woesearchaeota archaeon]HDD70639.1 30S ribosomal protein S19 [Candidatus Woesearchaeota archaeon]
MAKVLTYKGKTEDELKGMSIAEFAELTTARSRRTLQRGLTDSQKIFLKRLQKATKPLKTHCRDMVIVPEMLGKKVLVHNGKDWNPVEITVEMLGKRLGEFSLSRKRVSHSAPGIGATRSSKHLSVR